METTTPGANPQQVGLLMKTQMVEPRGKMILVEEKDFIALVSFAVAARTVVQGLLHELGSPGSATPQDTANNQYAFGCCVELNNRIFNKSLDIPPHAPATSN